MPFQIPFAWQVDYHFETSHNQFLNIIINCMKMVKKLVSNVFMAGGILQLAMVGLLLMHIYHQKLLKESIWLAKEPI